MTAEPRAVPQHVAIIMDGNGRWAKSRGLPRVAGHKRGADAVRVERDHQLVRVGLREVRLERRLAADEQRERAEGSKRGTHQPAEKL